MGVVDFGVESERHYAALQHAVIYEDVTLEELDDRHLRALPRRRDSASGTGGGRHGDFG
jgi:hypothetical protein